MAKWSDIPQEILDIIIDFLHGNLESLASCSLVARSWLPSSHYHLFCRLTVTDSPIVPDLPRVLASSTTMSSGIQELRLVFPLCSRHRRVDPRTLVHILGSLPSLHSLWLWGLSIEPFPWEAIYCDIPYLRVLELSDLDPMADDFVRIMAMFSRASIDRLILDNSTIRYCDNLQNIDPASLFPQNLWKVRALRIGHEVSPCLFEILPQVLSLDTLESLDVLALQTSRTRQAAAQFLTAAGQMLQHLRWDTTPLYLRPSQSFWGSLIKCSSLTCLHLHLGAGYFYDRFEGLQAFTRTFPTFVFPYVTPSIQLLTLAFEKDWAGCFFQSWLDCVDWAVLEEQLLAFKELREARIILEDPAPEPMADHYVEAIPELHQSDIVKSLPRLHAAGKLRFPSSACFGI